MPAYIVVTLPQTPRQPAGGAAVALPSGRILARYPATVDSPEAREIAQAAAARHAKALGRAWRAHMIEQHEIDQRTREAEEAAQAEKAWSDDPAPVEPAEEVPAVVRAAMGSRFPDAIDIEEARATRAIEARPDLPPLVAAGYGPATPSEMAKRRTAKEASFDF